MLQLINSGNMWCNGRKVIEKKNMFTCQKKYERDKPKGSLSGLDAYTSVVGITSAGSC
jgi:hypothetical protein